MYEAFFGFRERPFQLTPNPRFLFLNPGHREALATLRYGLTSSLGITLLLGEAGTGKTTLLRAALHAERRPEHRHAVLSNPTLAPGEFYEVLSERFGLLHASGSKGRFLLALERDLLQRQQAGGLTALIVDEAQSLTHELFEEIRLLANLETDTAKLVNLVLVGQPELADRLNDPSLSQFKQRIILRCSLPPLDLASTASYIAARLRVAGAVAGEVFTKEAVRAIYQASRGIPRTIGVVCENALLAGYAAQRKPVDRSIVADVCRDFDLPVDGNGRPPAPASPVPVRALSSPAPATALPFPAPATAAPSTAAPREDAAVRNEPAAVEPSPRRAASRSWFSSRRKQSPRELAREPESATENDGQAAVVPDRRIFRFF